MDLPGFTHIKIDPGSIVICDICNKEWTAEDPTSGGFLFQSKGVCPDCAPRFKKTVEKYKEQKYIREYCPPHLSFYFWIMLVREED